MQHAIRRKNEPVLWKIKELMNNYQDLILENQMVLDELEQGVSGKDQ